MAHRTFATCSTRFLRRALCDRVTYGLLEQSQRLGAGLDQFGVFVIQQFVAEHDRNGSGITLLMRHVGFTNSDDVFGRLHLTSEDVRKLRCKPAKALGGNRGKQPGHVPEVMRRRRGGNLRPAGDLPQAEALDTAFVQ